MFLHEIVDDETRRIARDDPAVIIEKFFQIVNKDGTMVPFILNEPQRIFYDSMTSRDNILKARKEGFSSLILAIWTVRFLFLENVWCVCISHEAEATKRLFSKVEFYVENLAYNGEPIQVDLSVKSNKRIKYKHTNSEFYVGTAGSLAFGRGDTIHYLHASELAFWKNPDELMTGLQNSVPDNPKTTQIVIETTANGMGTSHHEGWKDAVSGKSSFKPHFYGWNTMREYRRIVPPGFVMTDEEEKLALKYDLSREQIAWRRWKISSMPKGLKDGMTKEDRFKQEYPISDREAFLSTGRPVFPAQALEYYDEVCVRPPLMTGDLVGWDPPIFQENSEGSLDIWELPKDDVVYVIGADVGESSDYSYASVIRRDTCEQVAEFHGQRDTFEFAAILYRLGKYYGNALLAPERNNQGVAVVAKLDELGYTNMYVRESLDDVHSTRYNELGWRTDMVTRPIMLGDLIQFVIDRKVVIRSERVLAEMRSFVRNQRGRMEAASGAHDDRVIGIAITLQMYKFVPEPIENKGFVVRDYRPNSSMSNFYR